MSHPSAVIEAVAAVNIHVRDMLALKRLADRWNINNPRVETNLENWVTEWLERNPRQAALIKSRAEVESAQ
jgi:hypothetical protein